jgi:ATP phosphoribosyltransferase
LALLLKGALNAETSVLLKMNADDKNVKTITDILPSLHAPTVNPLQSDGWVAIETVIEEKVVREIIPLLKEAGAEGIIEIPLNKLIR